MRPLLTTLVLVGLPMAELDAQPLSPHLDPSFGNNGITTSTLAGWDGAGVLKHDPANGGFFVFGTFRDTTCILATRRYFLAKYTEAGVPDGAFNGGQPLPIEALFCGLWVPPEASMTVQQDGKPVITGMSPELALTNLRVLRFTASGQPDPSFANNGVFEFQGAASSYHTGEGITQDGQGRLVATGFYNTSILDQERMAVVLRLLEDGTLDPSFGTGGYAVYDRFDAGTESDEQASTPVPLPNGDLLIGGSYEAQDGDARAYVMRVDGTGAPVTSFGNNAAYTSGASSEEFLITLDVAPAEGIIDIALRNNAESGLIIHRVDLNTGQPINAFGNNGQMHIAVGGGATTDDVAYELARDAYGRLYVAGARYGPTDTTAVIARITNDGFWDADWLQTGVDETFGQGSIHGLQMKDNALYVAGYRGYPADHVIARYGATAVGTNDAMRTSTIRVFPNPTERLLTIEHPGAVADVRVLRPDGLIAHLPRGYEPQGPLRIDLGDLPPGLYLLDLRFADGTRAVERVVKQ